MSRLARAAVRTAVVLTPPRIRDRYDEQWAADLRDAPAVGVPEGEIARGAWVVALTAERSAAPVMSAIQRADRRSGIALAVAASSAALALAGWPMYVVVWGQSETRPLLSLGYLVAGLWPVLAFLVTLALVTSTRGLPGRRRSGALLIAVSGVLPAASAIATRAQPSGVFLDAHDPAWPIAIVVFLGGAILYGSADRRWRRRRPSRDTAVPISFAAVAVLGYVLCLALELTGPTDFVRNSEYTPGAAALRRADAIEHRVLLAFAIAAGVIVLLTIVATVLAAAHRRALVIALGALLAGEVGIAFFVASWRVTTGHFWGRELLLQSFSIGAQFEFVLGVRIVVAVAVFAACAVAGRQPRVRVVPALGLEAA